jgi:hypothetical protein
VGAEGRALFQFGAAMRTVFHRRENGLCPTDERRKKVRKLCSKGWTNA